MNKNIQQDINRIKNLLGENKIITEDRTIEIIEPVPIPKNFIGNFGEKRGYENHPGTDIPVKSGTEVKSILDGVVTVADINHNNLCGGTIDIDHKNGFWTRFCHIKRIDVKKGDIVKQGQVIGLSGGDATDPGAGNSKGAHLHWTLKKNGELVDPVDYVGETVENVSDLSIGDSEEENLLDKILNSDYNGKKVKDIIGSEQKGETIMDFFRRLAGFIKVFHK